MSPKYEIELWSRTGVLLADISKYVKNLAFSMERNEAEDVSFDIDLSSLQNLASSIGVSPLTILGPYQTDVKIKRNGEYLFGSHVGYVETVIGSTNGTVRVRAFGYLNLLIDRYVTKTYTQVDAVQIAWGLIYETQQQTNGDLGITQSATQTVTVDRDRTYIRQNVKEGIVNLTKLINGNFDFEFTHDKEFKTYTLIGSNKSENLKFIYPGNIKELIVPRDGLALYNKIYGLGSGFGEEVLSSTQGDDDSQLNYGVHERISTYNSVILQDTLDQNTAAELNLRKYLLEIPQMVVNGEDFDLNNIGIGDRVTVRVEDNPFLATVDGVYRIERIEVTVDENEAEEIKIYFDNLDIDSVLAEDEIPDVEEES